MSKTIWEIEMEELYDYTNGQEGYDQMKTEAELEREYELEQLAKEQHQLEEDRVLWEQIHEEVIEHER